MQIPTHGKKKDAISTVLGIRAFRHLWIGQMCSQLAVNMMLFTLAIRIYQVTGSNTAVSGLYVAYGVPALAFGMVAGVMVDHLDKRFVLAWCNVSRAFLMLLYFIFPANLFVIYIIAFINAVLTQFYVPAEAPLIPRVVPESQLLTANSIFSFTFFTSMSLGLIIAGPVLKYLGEYGAFIVLFLLYVIAVWSVLGIPKQKEDVAGFRAIMKKNFFAIIRRVFSDLRHGFSFVAKTKKIVDALLLLSVTQVVFALLGVLGPGFADRVLQIDVTDVSLVILGPAVLGIILGAVWMGTNGSRFHPEKLTAAGVYAGGILLIAIALLVRFERASLFQVLVPSFLVLPLTLLLFFLLGVTNSFLDVPSNATIQKEAQGDMRGRIYGMLTSAGGGIGILPVVVGGILADVVGIGKVLLLVGVGIIAYGILRGKRALL